jgi:ubiquinone/menaquinone biosynthesis C-methylase UbiE
LNEDSSGEGMSNRIGRALLVCLAVLACIGEAEGAQESEFERDAARLASALDLRAGQAVADIGAGGGELALELAKAVGPSGIVYATEIGEERLQTLREAVAKSGRSNITVLEAHPTRTNLPSECCRAVIMRLVYHHFQDPAAMNRSLLASLEPGGLVAVLDFPTDDGQTAAPAERAKDGNHGVDAATVVDEMTAAGFERVLVDTDSKPRYLVVVRRPM